MIFEIGQSSNVHAHDRLVGILPERNTKVDSEIMRNEWGEFWQLPQFQWSEVDTRVGLRIKV